MSPVVFQNLDQVVHAEQPQAGALVNRALERPGMDHCGQVENRPRRSGARDSAPGRELLIPQDPGTVHPDSSSPFATRPRAKGHVDRPATGVGPDRPEGGRVCVADRRTDPASQHGGHPVSLFAERSVPNGVHAVVDAMKPARRTHSTKLRLAVSEGVDLSRRDDAVVASRESRDPGSRTRRGEFLVHGNGKSPRAGLRPPRTRE
jgi:hypothetical protein